ncbi:MAG: hypothetical protein WCT24_01120 [Patescibacteria group bacterium]|jgi:hypothetical protein
MKICICGSIAFFDELLALKSKLEARGHVVAMPPTQVPDEHGKLIDVREYYKIRKSNTNDQWVWDKKEIAMQIHFEKIEWSDAILVANYKKSDIEGYVGCNTLIEMGVAMFLKKPIYFLFKIPEMNCKEEILGMKPIILNEDLRIL